MDSHALFGRSTEPSQDHLEYTAGTPREIEIAQARMKEIGE